MLLDNENPSYNAAPALNAVGFKGYIVDLLRELAKTLNIDFTLSLVPDAKYGHEERNGRWNGLVGELMNKVTFSSLDF